jgi:hypothetical protein
VNGPPNSQHAKTEVGWIELDSLNHCGEGNLRRAHKDFADVVEIILQNRLDGSFAAHLHMSLRETYRRLVRSSRGEA